VYDPGKAVGILYRKHHSTYFYVIVQMEDGSFERVSTNGQALQPTGEELGAAIVLTKAETTEICEMCVEFCLPFEQAPKEAANSDKGLQVQVTRVSPML
jgi:hypothetical protein